MTSALRTRNLSKRYGRTWALQDCTLDLPAGKVAALVGPNGSGKTTLLNLAVGLSRPTAGEVDAFGLTPGDNGARALPQVGYLAQDRPLYRGFTVAEMLKLGRKLNPRWDDALARTRLARLGIPLDRKVGKLSGGQQSQVALVMTLAKRPRLLLLDEPMSALDPLARREFMATLMDAVAEDGVTVLLSSHIIADLERVCDYLIILSASRVQLTGEMDAITARHKLLVGRRCSPEAVEHVHSVVHASYTPRQTSLLVRLNGHVWDPGWEVRDVPLEDIVLAYLGQATTVGRVQSATSAPEEVPA